MYDDTKLILVINIAKLTAMSITLSADDADKKADWPLFCNFANIKDSLTNFGGVRRMNCFGRCLLSVWGKPSFISSDVGSNAWTQLTTLNFEN